jgi:beta-xylosidase
MPGPHGILQRFPVVQESSPDPAIMKVGRSYFLYTTNDFGMNIPKRTSRDLIHWTWASDAMPQRPSWAQKDTIWAPHAVQTGDHFTLFFAARQYNGKMAVGYAVSKSPDGPFTSQGVANEGLLVTHPNPNVTIDPDVLLDDDGRMYLYWGSANGDARADVLGIRGQEIRIAADGRSIERLGAWSTVKPKIGPGNARPPWLPQDRLNVEAPWVMKRNGWYYMFYSDGVYDGTTPQSEYALNVVRSRSPLDFHSPQALAASRRVVSGTPAYRGPGHPTVTPEPDGEHYALAYHAWVGGINRGQRETMIDRIEWRDDWPFVTLGADPSARASR